MDIKLQNNYSICYGYFVFICIAKSITIIFFKVAHLLFLDIYLKLINKIFNKNKKTLILFNCMIL